MTLHLTLPCSSWLNQIKLWVLEDSAGLAVAGNLHVDDGPRVAAPSLRRCLPEASEAFPPEVRQSHSAPPSRNTFSPTRPQGAALWS